MRTLVSNQPWIGASRVPFLPPPSPVSVAAPSVCACGAALTLEMERDLGECVDCSAEAAGVSNRRPL